MDQAVPVVAIPEVRRSSSADLPEISSTSTQLPCTGLKIVEALISSKLWCGDPDLAVSSIKNSLRALQTEYRSLSHSLEKGLAGAPTELWTMNLSKTLQMLMGRLFAQVCLRWKID
ncbi:hypothetical protein ACOSP7_018440 [Xanthoceras sorbifolium]